MLSLLLLLSAVGFLPQQSQQVVPSMPPPAWHHQALLDNETHNAVAEVLVLTRDRQVTFKWTFGGDAPLRVREVHDLNFWPTAAAHLDENTLVVAGRVPSSGKAILQRWDLSWDGPPSSESPTTVTPTTLYTGFAGGLSHPRSLLANAGAENEFFVLFDSGQLFSFHKSTGAHTQLFGGANLIETLTFADVDRKFSAEHETLGYVYSFHCASSDCDIGGAIFYDTNKDGILDSFIEGEYGVWASQLNGLDWVEVH